MPQFDFNIAWEVLTDAEKKRVFAIWCYQTAEVQTDWAKVAEAAASGQATIDSMKTYQRRTLKKLKDAGAELDEDSSPVGGATSTGEGTTPKPTPKKKATAGEKKPTSGGRKRKAKEDIPVDSVEEELVTKKVKEEVKEEVDGDGEDEQVI
ncbi:hypothetical protein H2199_000633 [Coniosporium tulheliwenetii]|uniref:Uncharacterized protein n=1 Tax=Coniosporium tulheliwenetii TaxID=3383036 RepID=A0ACC2ZM95_9PEZI|nr:hypothetical protein H2199_000633 [Cladosporium sp. JES 115]